MLLKQLKIKQSNKGVDSLVCINMDTLGAGLLRNVLARKCQAVIKTNEGETSAKGQGTVRAE